MSMKGFGRKMRVSRKIDERFCVSSVLSASLHDVSLCSQSISHIAAERDRTALRNHHTNARSSALARFGSSQTPVHHFRFTKPTVLVAEATSDIGSTVPPRPPAPPAHKTGESDGPGRPRRLFLFILRNLHYLQEVGVLITIGAGAVYFVLNLMLNSKLESVEAKIEQLDAKVVGKIENLDAKLEKRQNDLDLKVDKLESRFDKLESKFDARFDKVDARFDTLEEKVTTLIESQKRRDLVTVGSSVLVSILATSFLQVSMKK